MRPLTLIWCAIVGLITLGCAETPQATGGTFRVNMQSEPDTIDPGRSNFSTSLLVASQVFEGLFEYDRDLNLVPAVAQSIPTVENGGISADGRVYTIRLQPSRWSDGQPVTAGDFAYAVRRSLNPRLAAPYAHVLYDIEGAEAYNTALGTKDQPRTPSDADLSGLEAGVQIEARDENTLVVRLRAPRPTMLHALASWVAWPVRRDTITKFGDQWTEPPNLVGNGPFVLSDWQHGSRMEFVPNSHYTRGKSRLDRLVFVQMTDANQAFLAYRNGELDAVAVPDAAVTSTGTDPVLAAQAKRISELVTFGFQFNTTEPPFNDVRVRRAISTAIDRNALVDQVAQGIGRVAYSPVPPGMAGHDPELGKEFRFDPARARQLLAEAGFADPARFPKVNFTFADNSSNRVRAEFFQAQLKQNLGIEVQLDPLDARAFQQRFNARQFQLVFGGWGADYADPDNIVPELFTSDSGNNRTGFRHPSVDAATRECRSLLDSNRRLAACAEAQRLVVQEQPWVFAFYRERYWLVKPNVQGFAATAKDHLPGSRYYRNITVTP